LVSLNIRGKKIRIYNDVDCDCGKRRNKRDKSIYVIGYRLHTLNAIDAKTGHSFPLVALLAPANHHDSHFLPFLVNLDQAMGIELQLITADEAYHDKDGSLFEETGVIVTTPPSSKVLLPENTDANTGAVFCNDECSFPMLHVASKTKKTNTNAVPLQGNVNFPVPAHNIVLYHLMVVCFSEYPIILNTYNRLIISERTVKGPLIS